MVGSKKSPNWQDIPLIYQVSSLPSFGGYIMNQNNPLIKTTSQLCFCGTLCWEDVDGKGLKFNSVALNVMQALWEDR